MLRFKFGWLAKALWAIGGAAITFLAIVIPRVYDAGAVSSKRDDHVQSLQVQVQSIQEQMDRIQTEVEWLIRHNPESKDAPLLEAPQHNHSWIRTPNTSENANPNPKTSDVPSSFESILGEISR